MKTQNTTTQHTFKLHPPLQDARETATRLSTFKLSTGSTAPLNPPRTPMFSAQGVEHSDYRLPPRGRTPLTLCAQRFLGLLNPTNREASLPRYLDKLVKRVLLDE
ncbi:hypothetical protein B9Q03_08770 [Candidatus Marsarchaeota G2 archaeon OSP_D]|uniref:Uncharacterized protein n=4 Tax=Candidatus Marsarchaeota group 2 TaxID=2203771 RepID=A0A2R6B7C0_9ARCH|nr:MAG: hypothetical protein B9Q03_08770 [Candidatus Marsarchaeota G2 archaeon OSP_D]PSN94526.1 MAG: hypothetical protein B9Q06_08980 [Candidatus Marsarchaeota G2 archaeon ECH_B_2]PSN98987.1 MAG: hypothetical protein B9Q07_08240 [Candidatus Marsarchaeota G2 archaeon ECH_B_3]PSO01046.1 MAG: hypothetical protein B9Q05_09530 [Candidatus Marsarchaeota G2 archaeon ECH_B_1]